MKPKSDDSVTVRIPKKTFHTDQLSFNIFYLLGCLTITTKVYSGPDATGFVKKGCITKKSFKSK